MMGITQADEAKLKPKIEAGEFSQFDGDLCCGMCHWGRQTTNETSIQACGCKESPHYCHMLSIEHPACGVFE